MGKKIVEKGYDKIANWYHKDRKTTRETIFFLKKIVEKLPKRGKVLDLGCGTGYPATKFFSDKGYDVMGVDLSSEMLKIAKEVVPSGKFIKKDMTKINFPKDSFDIIVSFAAILHVPKKQQKGLFKKMYKILKPNGRVLVSITNVDHGTYTNNWMGKTKMYWVENSKKENLNLIGNSGFKIIQVKDIGPKNDQHSYILAKK
ncbi:MAG: class I SAM-dependent methyltransferase [archaeon]|nr:class I SAM-dependent methyltransferase [archaeon]